MFVIQEPDQVPELPQAAQLSGTGDQHTPRNGLPGLAQQAVQDCGKGRDHRDTSLITGPISALCTAKVGERCVSRGQRRTQTQSLKSSKFTTW